MIRNAIILTAVSLLAVTSGVLAQSSDSFQVRRHVIAAGGGRSMSAGYRVSGATGQAIASGPRSASASFRIASGYWAGIPLGTESATHSIYLPLVLRGPN